MRAERPEIEQVLLKLNEGVSGEGNAKVDLSGLPAQGGDGESSAIEERIRGMSFESDGHDPRPLPGKARRRRGASSRSGSRATSSAVPSVQLRVTPLGKVELLSTHDQLLGGPSGQTFLGCRFPADPEYAPQITAEAAKIGARLAAEGVIGRFALDFVTVRRNGAWIPYAIELNLRKGRHDAPLPDAPVPDRRHVRPRAGGLHRAERPGEVLRRERPRREPGLPDLAPTTCSTSPPATGSTSTMHGRPGSSST